MPNGLHDAVLAWLKTAGGIPEAVHVVQVSGSGTDWAGNTEGGFYEKFGVDVTWEDGAGTCRTKPVAGEQMQSLWDAVVRAWPR